MVGAHWHIGYGRQKPIHCRLLSDENPTILTTNNNNTPRYKPHHQVTTYKCVSFVEKPFNDVAFCLKGTFKRQFASDPE